jgi:hypothetical protein
VKRCLLLATMFSVFLAACATPASAPGDDPTAEPTQTAAFGTQFSLGVGETIMLEDSGSISFDGVSRDARCPTNVECAEMGPIIIDLTFTPPDGPSAAISLTLLGEQSEPGVVGAYTITLHSVDPYPLVPGGIDPADYVVALEVTPADPAPTTASTIQPFGEPFTLPIDQTINLEDGGSITFDGVSEDSRCPSDVQCVWAGQVIADLTVTGPQGQSGQVSLTLMGGQSDPVITGDYTITLLAVDPYPESSGPFDASSYVATLQVTLGGIAPTDEAPTQEATEAGSMNLQFKLAIGETLTLADGGLITFERVSEDSRCPTEVDCFWSGQIVIDLTITTPEGQSEHVSLTLIQDKSDPATVGAYTITLIAVDPYPKQPGDVDPASYVASLQVVK